MVHLPPPLDDIPPPPAFDPVVTRPRRDGWTPAAQRDFIAALAGGDSVAAACRRVGRSPRSAYTLRDRSDAASFAAAWDLAVTGAGQILDQYALDRVRTATVRPVLYRGRQVGERIVHNDTLLIHMLRRTAPRPCAMPDAAKFTADERFDKRLL